MDGEIRPRSVEHFVFKRIAFKPDEELNSVKPCCETSDLEDIDFDSDFKPSQKNSSVEQFIHGGVTFTLDKEPKSTKPMHDGDSLSANDLKPNDQANKAVKPTSIKRCILKQLAFKPSDAKTHDLKLTNSDRPSDAVDSDEKPDFKPGQKEEKVQEDSKPSEIKPDDPYKSSEVKNRQGSVADLDFKPAPSNKSSDAESSSVKPEVKPVDILPSVKPRLHLIDWPKVIFPEDYKPKDDKPGDDKPDGKKNDDKPDGKKPKDNEPKEPEEEKTIPRKNPDDIIIPDKDYSTYRCYPIGRIFVYMMYSMFTKIRQLFREKFNKNTEESTEETPKGM